MFLVFESSRVILKQWHLCLHDYTDNEQAAKISHIIW